VATGDGRLAITRHGDVRKLVAKIDPITFSGPEGIPPVMPKPPATMAAAYFEASDRLATAS
jgi:hypothetical protein